MKLVLQLTKLISAMRQKLVPTDNSQFLLKENIFAEWFSENTIKKSIFSTVIFQKSFVLRISNNKRAIFQSVSEQKYFIIN